MHFTKCRNIKRKAAFSEVELVEKPFQSHLRWGLLRANVQSRCQVMEQPDRQDVKVAD